MRILISKKVLFNKLFILKDFVPKKSSIPILENVLLKAKNNKLKLFVIDLNSYAITKTKKVEIEKEGSITVSINSLFSILKDLKVDMIRLEVIGINNEFVLITSGMSEYKIPSLSADDFPVAIKGNNKQDLCQIKAEVLLDALRKSIFAVTADKNRYNLSGIYFTKSKKDSLRLIATDGYRMNLVKFKKIKINLKEKEGMIIANLSKLYKILNKNLEEEVKISYEIIEGNNNFIISFKLKNFIFKFREIEGNFPDYKQVIPDKKKQKNIAVLNRLILIGVLKRLNKINNKYLTFDFKKTSCYCLVKDSEKGEVKEKIKIKFRGQDKFKINISNFRLMEFLKSVNSDFIEMKMSDEKSVIQFNEFLKNNKDKEEQDFSYNYLLMPIYNTE